jgi:N-acetylmuramoyl-L-alanine amidase
MNRSRVRVFKTLAFLAAFLTCAVSAPAQERVPNLWFQGTRLVLEHPVASGGDLAVSVRDAGMRRFLERLGATVAYEPGQRYAVVTSEDRRTIVFTLGDPAYTVAGVRARAPFAPFVDGRDPVLPFFALARALYVEPLADGGETVLQPRLGALDVRADGPRTTVTVRAAMPLVARTDGEIPERLAVSFLGLGSALAPARRAAGGAVDTIDLTTSGSARVPTTTLTIAGPPGTTHRLVPSASPDTFTVVFEARATAAAGGAFGPPTPPPAFTSPPTLPPGAVRPVPGAFSPSAGVQPTAAPPLVAGRATVTDLVIEPAADDALAVRLALSGAVAYQWHRLADHRWYVDLLGTTLSGPGRDERPQTGAVQGVRVRQIGSSDAPAVRVALTLSGEQRVDLTPTEAGLTILVGTTPSSEVARTGRGRTGGLPVVASAASPDPGAGSAPSDSAGGWKYAPGPAQAPVPANAGSKLIVIDPGHGGGDPGAAHNGLVEKVLTFDIAQRLKTLLVAQGWTVRLTRDSDIDPVSPDNLARMRSDGKPNPDDRAYLQTRCDVANLGGARLFISIHVNSAPSTSAAGTTFYWYKPQDAALAQALERAVIPLAGTQDDGTRHENFYVVRHTTMPAVLVETAFITNPGDVALLRQPSFLQSVAQGLANGVKAYTAAAQPNPVSVQQ